MLDVEDLRLDGEAPGEALGVRRYRPHRLRTDAVLVWFHGGGWTTGGLGYSDGFCRMLADGIGCEVRSVNYRLAPEHQFPAAVQDALRAARWTASTAPVIVGGDSAGGNLAAVVAQQLRKDEGVEVVGQLLVYPVVDADRTRPSYVRNDGLVLGVEEMGWFFDRYVPNPADRESVLFAPIRAGHLAGLPPAVIAVGGHDPLHDEGVEYAHKLRAARVPVTLLDFASLPHGFLRFTGPVLAAADAAGRIVAAATTLVHRP
jgi:acetyl esterase